MALTDWLFPEMGYTCEQDKRALYEKKIAPVYSGVTDNRSRMAEGNFCHTLVLPVKICGKQEDFVMRTMGKIENKKNMQENERRDVSRMKAYQKLAERAISRKRPNHHMNRRG